LVILAKTIVVVTRPSFHCESRANHGSRSVGFYLQSATQPPQPLSHSGKSHAAPAQFDQFVLLFHGHTLPAILNLNRQKVRVPMETDSSRGAPRMAVDVGQAFLHDPEDGNLQFVR
jgi:hypothetical protein